MLRDEPLAYHRATADDRFWTDHWASEDLDHLLAVAEISPLTDFLQRYVRPGRRVLEAGCGLGQYVRYFAERGVDIVGVDYSSDAIERHLAVFPESDVRIANVEALPFPDDSFDVYVSLGVIEHSEAGAEPILREARRVLAPDGDLLVSTPYLNVTRRLLRTLIEREQDAVHARGADFYQYAFSRRTLDEVLRAAGFEVVDRYYYDPGRGVDDVRALLQRGRPSAPRAGGANRDAPTRRTGLTAAVIYSTPFLASFAHMQIVRARPID